MLGPGVAIDAGKDAATAPDVALDARPDVRDAAPSAICVVPDGGFVPGGPLCWHTLEVLEITRSSSTCFVDTVVKEGAFGELAVDCSGGAAEATFGDHVFRGSFDGDQVDICTGTSFDWSDGCRWDSSQRVQGSIGSGEVRFDYTEAPAPGQTRCLTPCTATARVLID